MINGLDLFSGYGGISLALRRWVRPLAYCEIERYAQGILLSRMLDGSIPFAPIWDDVSTLDGNPFRGCIDIIYGGFPCQDISLAGAGKGMGGKRSGLFSEICRLAKEIKPEFLFLENVPAIRTRGLDTVIEQLTDAGYDLRWQTLSASEIGANHKRDRWFLLGKSKSKRVERELPVLPKANAIENRPEITPQDQTMHAFDAGEKPSVLADADSFELWKFEQRKSGRFEDRISNEGETFTCEDGEHFKSQWWAHEPNVGRVVDGCSFRLDRIRALGNGVVPLQVQTAFKELMGINDANI